MFLFNAWAGTQVHTLDIHDHPSTPITIQKDLRDSLGVSPGILRDIHLTPGQRYEGEYKIYNEGTNDISVVITTSPFSYSADYKNIDLMASSSYNQIQEWVEIDRNPIPLKSGETKIVPFAINVPPDTRGGGQYFSFINRIIPNSEPGNQGGTANTVKQVSLTVGTTVEGEDLDACSEMTSQKITFWQLKSPITTSATIKNCGNVDFVAYGRVEVKSAIFSDKIIYETPVSDITELRIFPNGENNSRGQEVSWNNPPMLGLFKVTQKITIGDATETITKIVLLLPLWVALIAIAAIIAIILLARATRKSFKRYRRFKIK